MTKRKKEIVEIDSDTTTKKKKNGFEIDWESVMQEDDNDGRGKEELVPELEIVNADTTPPPPAPPPPPEPAPSQSVLFSEDQMDCHKTLSDQSLDEVLERNKAHLVKLGPNLPDKGEKIRLKIASLEAEKKSRASRPSKIDGNGSSKLNHSTSSGSNVFAQGNNASKDTAKENSDSKEVSRSTFAAFFSNPKTDTQSTKAFDKELEDLGCENGKHKADTNNKWQMLSKVGRAEHSEKEFYSGSKGIQKSNESNGKKKHKESSSYSLLDDDDSDSNGHETPKECSWKESTSQCSRRHKKSDDTVINVDVDEEEPQPSTVEEQGVELPEGLEEEIFYPTRDDPFSVLVCLKDLECLSPREFLTSSVMNFYIRYLQHEVSPENQISADCHFFTTYFYKKLTNAVMYKGNDKDAYFVKFRRWWKGVDLFRKAYIFVPIHEDLHWSLVIICIPDKEDESGLTILHLDSLGLHSKRSIVENVKRFLKDEWKYLNQDDDYSSDLPISEKVWRNFPRRISEADIQVPQQKNDFDCGPFVLFFIKRFIEEAPQRLKRKDLRMFDKKWFRPDEASALRIKIRDTLIDLFRVNNKTDETCVEQNSSDDNVASESRHCSSP